MSAKPHSQWSDTAAVVEGRPALGSVLGGKFRTVRQLGEGGMGVVFEAEHILSGKHVAIKWMQPDVASQPQAVERFLREARACALVRHPNVVDVYDVVHEGDVVFLVMELLEGEPLSAALGRGGMPAHELIALLIEAMRGVSAAHRQGVIHRDIKPDNIFLEREADRSTRTPKVLDFGISKLNAEGMALTQTGVMLGTPMYMSFEQLRGVRDIDVRTDVYAFGVILYEALTGRTPYEAQNLAELIYKIANIEPIAPKVLRPEIPSRLERIILTAMAKDRDARFDSLDVMIRELQPFATGIQFRGHMTNNDLAPLPCVVASPPQPVVTESPTASLEQAQTERSEALAGTNAFTPPSQRRRRAFWLVGVPAVGALLGGMTLVGWSSLRAGVSRAATESQVTLPLAAEKTASNSPTSPLPATESPEREPTVPAQALQLTTASAPVPDEPSSARGAAEPAGTQPVANAAAMTVESRSAKGVPSEHTVQQGASTDMPKLNPLKKASQAAGAPPTRSNAQAKPKALTTSVEVLEKPSGLRAGRPRHDEF